MTPKTPNINDEVIEIVDYQSERQEELDIIDRKCDDWVADKLKRQIDSQSDNREI